MLHLGFRHLLIGSVVAVLYSSTGLNAQNSVEKTEKMRQRLEQLFIWRVSDRLRLTPEQENHFSSQFKKLTEDRAKLSQSLESLLDQIEKKKVNKKESATLLTEYKAQLKKYNQFQNEELDSMGKIFDSSKMIDYVLLKREMTLKFKDVLVQGSQAKAGNSLLKEPEIIQEK